MRKRYKYITVLPDQTLIDVCIQEYGSLEALKWLLADNPDVIDTEKPEGLKLLIRADIYDESIVDYFENTIIVTQ
jgi:hypothetical protein